MGKSDSIKGYSNFLADRRPIDFVNARTVADIFNWVHIHPSDGFKHTLFGDELIDYDLPLTPEKLLKIKTQYTIMKENMSATVLELTKLISLLSSKCQAVMPTKLHHRFIQNLQIQSFRSLFISRKIDNIQTSSTELIWWILHHRMDGHWYQSKARHRCRQMLQWKIGAYCQGIRTWSFLDQGEANFSYQCFGTISNKVQFFQLKKTKRFSHGFHIQIDNKTTLSYFLKMGALSPWRW